MSRRLGPVIMLALGVVMAAPATAQENTLVVTPTEIEAGSPVRVTHGPGQTCGVAPEPGDEVAARLVGSDGAAVAETLGPVTPEGSWAIDLRVPDRVPAGPYTVEADCRVLDEVGFSYSVVTLNVLPPPPRATTTTVGTTAPASADESPTTAEIVDGVPRADIGALLALAVLLVLVGLFGSRWLRRRLVILGDGGRALVGWIGLIWAVGFTFCWLLAGWLVTGVSVTDDGIGALTAAGVDRWWLMTVGLFVGGLLLLWFAVGGRDLLSRCGSFGWGPMVLAGVGIGLIVLGALRPDCLRSDPFCRGELSWHHHAHAWLALLIAGGLIAAAGLLAQSFRRLGLDRLATVSRAAAFAMTLLFSLAAWGFGDAGGGRLERGGLLVAATWVGLLAWELIARSRTAR